jgi:hypothetical protein
MAESGTRYATILPTLSSRQFVDLVFWVSSQGRCARGSLADCQIGTIFFSRGRSRASAA